jgi:hypothetical protein
MRPQRDSSGGVSSLSRVSNERFAHPALYPALYLARQRPPTAPDYPCYFSVFDSRSEQLLYCDSVIAQYVLVFLSPLCYYPLVHWAFLLLMFVLQLHLNKSSPFGLLLFHFVSEKS